MKRVLIVACLIFSVVILSTHSFAQVTSPVLDIPDQIPAESGMTVTVPINYTANGNNISSMIFSVDFDEGLLGFDPADSNFDTIPDSITINPQISPFVFSIGISFDPGDTDGELDFNFSDISPPLAALPEGVLLTITFNVGNPADESEAAVNFSQDPTASFGNTSGQSVPGITNDGSVVITPSNETNCFDGIDNDGDGLMDCADSDCMGVTEGACTTGQPGICSTGILTCQGSVEVCVPDNEPQLEVCDNVDNNCDGTIDEDLMRPTTCGVGECTGNTGMETCSAGQWGNDTCDPFAGAVPEGPPGDQVCSDTLDNDCDGLTDLGDGDCHTETETNCFDGIDNDGDGQTDCADSDCMGMTDGACATGQPGICSTGVLTCQGGAEVCVADNEPQTEVCDNVDNNCDGTIDEDLMRPTTCGVGECSGNTGMETCSAGTWGDDTCDPVAGAVPEGPPGDQTCGDTLDNDCDGATDGNDSDCIGVCQETGSISILSGQTLSGNPIDLTSIVTTTNATNVLYTVTEGIGCPGQTNEVIITQEDNWKYDVENTGATWMETGFDDSGWSTGNGIFGTEPNLSIATPISDTSTSIFFRKAFTVCNPSQVTDLVLNALFDDGMVVYINGTQVYSEGVSGDPPPYNGGVTMQHEAVDYEAKDLASVIGLDALRNLLVPGSGNVLAVGDYNNLPVSSDIVWDGELVISSNVTNNVLFSGNSLQAQSVDTTGWTDGEKDLFVMGDDATCQTPLTPAQETFIFEGLPGVETDCFDGLDNDNDGQMDCADSDCMGVTDGACTTDQPGICSTGILTCQGGGEVCVADNEPQTEVCDNVDNNCDGSIDEDLMRPTTCGTGECSGNAGMEICNAGVWGNDTCDPLAGAVAEICDNLDNDCDGSIDEDLMRPTTCGVGECAGNTGMETCDAGVWGDDTCDPFAGAMTEGPPGNQTCGDTLDNDCDGQTDLNDSGCQAATEFNCFDGIDNDGDGMTDCEDDECSGVTDGACATGQFGICAPGTRTCQGGGEVCVADNQPQSEVCDNLDNDCDGSIDEGLIRTTTCGVGECSGNTGMESCSAGQWGNDTCDPLEGAVTEGPAGDQTCDDTLDNDCDGLTDSAEDPDCVDNVFTLPPPVNQKIGIPDSVFSDLQEDDCRFCHDNPDIVQPPPGDPNPDKWNVDRHHLRYGQPLEEGFCSVNTNNICTIDADCNQNVCALSGSPCGSDTDCPEGQTCGELCVGGTVAPFPPDQNGDYECTTCHPILLNGAIEIIAVRDCLFCHQESPHHQTSEAQSQNCQFCHGDLVNNIGDGHIIPTYDPSLVTPNPSEGNGEPLNSEGNGAGACNYCHSTGTGEPGSIDPGVVDNPDQLGPFGGPVFVYWNSETHHSTGLGVFDSSKCLWCHNIDDPGTDPIRRCEGCHGYESLHNIAVDSDDPGDDFNPAGTPGEENPGWSHVGNNDDCWGCHGFSGYAASVPALGATVPYINESSLTQAVAGKETLVTLSGINFQNTVETTTYTSNVTLTAEDGTSIEIAAEFASASSLTFTIPASAAPGSYDVRAVKTDKISNPVNIALMPDVAISRMSCDTKGKLLTIEGINFGEQYAGTEAYINVEIDGAVSATVLWQDSQIVVPVPDCRVQPVVTLNAFYGAEGEQCSKGCVQKKRRRRR